MPQHQGTSKRKHNSSKPGPDDPASFTVTGHDGTRPRSGNGSDSSDSNKRSSGDESKIGKTPTSTTTGTGTSDTMTSQVKSNFLPSSYKIKWCRAQRETGYCPYEVKCMFAHTKAELRSRFQNVEEGITTEEAIREILRERVRAHRLALKRAAAEDASKSKHTDKQPDSADKNSSDDSSSIGSLDFGQLANCDADDGDDEGEKGSPDIIALVEQRRQQEASKQKKKPNNSKGVGFDKHNPKYYLDPDLPHGPNGRKNDGKCGQTFNLPISIRVGSGPIRVGSGPGMPLPKSKKTSPATNDSTSSPGAEGNGSGNGISGNGISGNGNSGTSNSSSGKQQFPASSEPATPNEAYRDATPTAASGQNTPGLMPVPSAVPGTGQAGSNSGGLMPMPMMYIPHQQQQYMPVMMVPTPMMPAYAYAFEQQAMMAATAAAGQAATPHGFVPIGVPQPYFFGGAPPQPTETMYPGATVYGTAAGAAASQPMYMQPMPPGHPMGMYSFGSVPPPEPPQ